MDGIARRAAAFLSARGALLTVGAAMEAVYLLYFLRRFPLLANYPGPYQDMGQMTGHSHTAFWGFIIAIALLFALLCFGWWEVRNAADRATLWLILGVGAVLAVTMVFVYPISALDIFAYVDYNLVLTQYHHNPLFTPPAAFPGDPLMALSDGWAPVPAPYGPFGILLTAIPTMLAGRNVLVTLILLKLLFSGMTLGSAFAVYRILMRVRPAQALSGALLVAWNPLILFETSANGHNDMAMVLVAMIGLMLLASGDLRAGPVVILGSTLVKFATGLLLPLAVLYALSRYRTWEERARYCAVTGAAMLGLVVVAYAPFWAGPDTVLNSIKFQNGRYLYSFSTLAHNLVLSAVTLNLGALIGRLLFLPVYLYACWLAVRDLERLLLACYIAVFGFLALANTNFLFWYGVLPLTLAAAVPSLAVRFSAIVMGYAIELAAALNIFVWVWIGVTEDTFRPIDNISYLIIFVVPAAVLACVEGIPQLTRARASTGERPPSLSGEV
jgi:hypothetical protein